MSIEEVLDYMNWKMNHPDSPYFENETHVAFRKVKELKLTDDVKAEVLKLEERLHRIPKPNPWQKGWEPSSNLEFVRIMQDLYYLMSSCCEEY